MIINIRSSGPKETMKIGENIAASLTSGAVIVLTGPLGCGKTVLTKGIARGLHIFDEITSPSFTIISSYTGDRQLFHIDLYRINHPEEFDELGLEEILNSSLYLNAVSVIEWGEKAKGILPEETITINFKIDSGKHRTINIAGNIAGLKS
ncbi:MAG: tRNA (adenosine(37)-N6)-threonylcarbamoyltransferase complex ATPase subunit type 1 TsaE [Spirochaetes bacterium]|nr:MAG: tRNA (adenosine(37)-N6)-threonylcarbamoyltransferase complex ATPase subunit type 1 TsaE [Spirochaetota bacterium]